MKKSVLLALSSLIVMVGTLTTLAQNSAQANSLLTPTPSPIPGPCVTPPPFPTATPWATITPTPVFTPTPTPSTTGSPTPTPCVIPPTMTPYPTFPPPPCETSTPPPSPGTVAPPPCLTTPTVTPTTTPIFSATVHITPSRTQVTTGETVTVMVDLTVSAGCQLPVYMLTLDQTGPGGALFAPAEVIVGPGVPMPTTITVTAVTTGTTTFHAEVDGERNCGHGWLWVYLHGYSEDVVVVPETLPGSPDYSQFLPLVMHPTSIYGSVLIEDGRGSLLYPPRHSR